MKVEDVLTEVLVRRGDRDKYDINNLPQDDSEINTIVKCINMIVSEIASDYLPVEFSEEVEAVNGIIPYDSLSKRLINLKKITKNNIDVAHIMAEEILITDVQSALDLMMTVCYETGTKNIAISKNLFADRFFILSSGLAGEILQKFVNYQFRVAVYGDYSEYTSKPLKDFIYESNNGRDIFFTASLEKAVEKLTAN